MGGYWGYLAAAAGSIVTLYLMFTSWVVGVGRDGTIKADAFGGYKVSHTLVNLWAGSPPPRPQINGTWAVLACAVAVVTAFAVAANIRARSTVLTRLAVGASLAQAGLVLVIIIHLNNKLEEIRAAVGITSYRDLGTQAGLIMRWAMGNGDYPAPGVRQVDYATASFTTSAWTAGAVSLISALAAIAQWLRGRTTSA
ncbi:hypothetical protein BJY24_003776 [Nocardia transvalensis]|uniref:Uncharacterized protein n=1 Tax=Nocardia transvalensis TaxID=37333 RepID=A0A7W9PG12_9NOCA|nr:hypothetical protein [Nocardia transvalensis]MBB5914909.1 hypothetical protein [Nocardia transvalensis]